MSPRDGEDRLRDIIERVTRIRFSENVLIEAEKNADLNVANTAFDAILYDLVVIGEAVKTFDDEIKLRHPQIPWTEITGMRDILAHEYFRVSISLVRTTIDTPLKNLRLACIKELASGFD